MGKGDVEWLLQSLFDLPARIVVDALHEVWRQRIVAVEPGERDEFGVRIVLDERIEAIIVVGTGVNEDRLGFNSLHAIADGPDVVLVRVGIEGDEHAKIF